MTFTTVYNVVAAGFPAWEFVSGGALMTGIGALLVFQPALTQRILPYDLQGRARVWFGRFFFGFGLLWTLLVLATTGTRHLTLVRALEGGRLPIVTGRVTEFSPMPAGGHRDESFTVAGRRFSYSDFVVTGGFNHSQARGGPIRPGIFVRITHDGDLIVRLEIADELSGRQPTAPRSAP